MPQASRTTSPYPFILVCALALAAASCGGGAQPADAGADGPLAACPGALEECGHQHGGWLLWCETGTVYQDDLFERFFCAPGSEEVSCSLGGRGDALPVHSCTTGCEQELVEHWFLEFEEPPDFGTTAYYQSFCSTGQDAGTSDAGSP